MVADAGKTVGRKGVSSNGDLRCPTGLRLEVRGQQAGDTLSIEDPFELKDEAKGGEEPG